MTAMRLAVLDLPEGNAMRAPGEAPGMMALESRWTKWPKNSVIDPIEFSILNDTQIVPGESERQQYVERLFLLRKFGLARKTFSGQPAVRCSFEICNVEPICCPGRSSQITLMATIAWLSPAAISGLNTIHVPSRGTSGKWNSQWRERQACSRGALSQRPHLRIQ